MESANVSLKNHFLIAMPQMDDPNFSGTLTYICDHNEHGAMGIIINRPLEIGMADILGQMDFACDQEMGLVYAGGPVQMERGFVLHSPRGDWGSTLAITDQISLTTSKDILKAMTLQTGPDHSLVALGYAGWGSGQLEQELAENFWLTCPASSQILFEIPYHRKLDAAFALLGIDVSHLSGKAGHA